MNYIKLWNGDAYIVNTFVINSDNLLITSILKAKRRNKKFIENLKGYDVIFSFDTYRDLKKFQYVRELDETSTLTCFFCSKQNGDTNFKNRSHVIPEFMGNKYLLHFEECDECNSYFSSTIEDALDKYTKVYRVFNRTKNKNRKLIGYYSINQKSHGKFNEKEHKFEFTGYVEDFLIDAEKNAFIANFEIEKHRPSNVYKALVKIIYGLLPREEHKNFTKMRNWIAQKDESKSLITPLTVYKTMLPFFNKKPLTIYVLKKNVSNVEEAIASNITEEDFDYMALINFGNVVFEFALFSDTMLQKAVSIPGFKFNFKFMPKPLLTGNPESIDLSSTEFKTDKVSIHFKYAQVFEHDL